MFVCVCLLYVRFTENSLPLHLPTYLAGIRNPQHHSCGISEFPKVRPWACLNKSLPPAFTHLTFHSLQLTAPCGMWSLGHIRVPLSCLGCQSLPRVAEARVRLVVPLTRALTTPLTPSMWNPSLSQFSPRFSILLNLGVKECHF